MLIPMLKAISNMLSEPVNEDRVFCANEVLRELITHLEAELQYRCVNKVKDDVQKLPEDPEAYNAARELGLEP